MAFCSAALLGPGGSAPGLIGFPFGKQREGPTLSTPSSAGGTAVTVVAEATGCGGCCCCCSTASATKPWLRIRALEEATEHETGEDALSRLGDESHVIQSNLTGLSGIFPSFIPPVEAVSEGAVGAEGGSDGVVVEEADIVTTVVAEVVLKEGMVTSWASEASSPQWGQKSMPPPFALLRPPPSTVTQPRWKR